MKSKLVILAALGLAYLGFIIALVPANVAISWFTLPNNIKLGEVSGTIWHSEISAVKVEQLVINRLNAEVSPLSLLMLSPSMELAFGERLSAGPQGNAELSLSASSISIENAVVNIAASEVAPLLALPIPIEAFGNAELTIDSLVFVENQCQQAAGTIRWQRAAVNAMGQEIDLGNFNATLSCQNNMLAIAVQPNNRLRLNYTALVSLSGKISGQGYLQPGGDFPRQLREALPFLGNPDSQGRYQLKL